MNFLSTLRGGGTETITNFLTSSSTLQGFAGLTTIAATVLTPLTLYKQAYSFSVGYGLSVCAMGLALLHSFSSSLTPSSLLLVSSIVFYGARLGLFLLLREFTVPSKQAQLKQMNKSPPLKRIPFALSVGLFYAFMTSPALFACRTASSLEGKALQITTLGIGFAWFGAITEAWTDAQKFIAKRGKDGSAEFQGPTTGWYGASRHPNYFAEVIFWLGVFVSGVPSFGKNIVAWLTGALGLSGIVSIMQNATARLDAKQKDAYGGQDKYDEWSTGGVSLLVPTNVGKAFVPVLISGGLTWGVMKYLPSLVL